VTADPITPPKAANRLNHILDAVSKAHGINRFPIDVKNIALEAGGIFGWNDKITAIESADIRGFEGCLFFDDDNKNWLVLYNHSIKSVGRIRFTQAHELGHYLLHRLQKNSFECATAADMYNLSQDDKDIESEADKFASYLLMPYDDFRKQISADIDLDILGDCASHYGVSLTAAILRWLEITELKAVLVISRSGFINWAWSSKPAFKAGAFFKTKQNIIPIPTGSIAANDQITIDRQGTIIPGKVWFKYAEPIMELREMKILSEQFDSVITLLIMPSVADVWPPWQA
jgi:Zn-dependent peptidase ImmA (M78 family)